MFSFLSDFTQYIYRLPLSTILIFILLSVLFWGVASVFIPRKPFLVLDVLLMLGGLFGVYLLTFAIRTAGEYEVILELFHSFLEARTQREMYRSMLMNIFLFVPFGMAFPFLLPTAEIKADAADTSGVGHTSCEKKGSPLLKRKVHYILLTMLAAFLIGTTVEFIQYYLKLGRCETDDVIMAVTGALIGSMSRVIRDRSNRRYETERAEIEKAEHPVGR